MGKITREKFKVMGNVFDNFTVRTIMKLSTKLNFDAYSLTPLFVGKESNVFLSLRHEEILVIKIYRLETCDFNHLYDYIRYDPRFLSLKKQRRKVIFAWTQREYRNLLKAREAGVRVPTPYAFENNVLVMEMIGEDNPAPQLKDEVPEDLERFFKDTFSQLKALVSGGLVHGDLSQFNILNYHGSPVFIDFSQATPVESPNALELLERDIKNLCIFFSKKGVELDKLAVRKDVLSTWPKR